MDDTTIFEALSGDAAHLLTGRGTDAPDRSGWPATDLEWRLARVWAEHGLTRRHLVTVQRTVRHQSRTGSAPSPEELWNTTAHPRAERFALGARDVLDQELPAWLARTLGTAPVVGREAGAVLAQVLAGVTGLDQLGRWWQRRLRWAAAGRFLPDLVVVPTRHIERTLDRAELVLLDQPPWAHGDRLLTAYELALADLCQYGRHAVARNLAARTPCPRRAGRPPAVVVLP